MAFNKKNLVKNQVNLISKIEAGEIDMSDETKNAITGFTKTPTIQKALTISNIIGNDNIITSTNKKELLLILADIIKVNINFENCPNDYEELKIEVKYLSGLTQYSFMLMAQRLMKIRDKKLYLEERDESGNIKYKDFTVFVENEMQMSRGTIYKMIDIYDYYGSRVSPGRHADELLQYTKLVPSLPLLKADVSIIDYNDKEKITELFWGSMLNNISKHDLELKANELKLKYGIIEFKKEEAALNINFKYESKGNKIKIGNKKLCEFSNDLNADIINLYKYGIKIISNNKEHGKETYFATVDNKDDEKVFKLFEKKLKEAREKGLKINIVVK